MKTALASVVCFALYWATITGSPAPSGPKPSAGPKARFPVPDIRYTERQLRLLNNPEEMKAATTDLAKRWTNATLYYTIDKSISSSKRRTMLAGWKWITDSTCIRILPRTRSSQKNYVKVLYKEEGWWSMLGMIGGPQEMNLGNDLTSGTAAHEMMHALGISHEHQRFDRDDWITIDWQALATFDTAESNWTSQYLKESQSEFDNYRVPYNYDSIMHYDGSSPEGGEPYVMYAKVKGMDEVMGQQTHLADTDIQLMKTIYGCK